MQLDRILVAGNFGITHQIAGLLIYIIRERRVNIEDTKVLVDVDLILVCICSLGLLRDNS